MNENWINMLLNNQNFNNNQNYIISKNKKWKAIQYAFHWTLDNKKNKVYCIKKIFNDKNYILNMETNDIWYIDKMCISWFNMELYLFLGMWLFLTLWLLNSWLPETHDKWIVLFTPIVLILLWLSIYFKNKKVKEKYIIFKTYISSDKIYLKRYK